jgi:hypothetical protein
MRVILYAEGFRKVLMHPVYDPVREIGRFDPSFLDLKKEAGVPDAVSLLTRYPDSIVGDLTASEFYSAAIISRSFGSGRTVAKQLPFTTVHPKTGTVTDPTVTFFYNYYATVATRQKTFIRSKLIPSCRGDVPCV